jgi:hypothetical protein
MSANDAVAPSKRNRWVTGAFVGLAAVLIGMKCLHADPADALRRQVTGSAEVRGAPLRAAVAPAPAEAPVVAPTPATPPVVAPPAPESPKPEPAVAKAAEAMHADNSAAKAITWDDISKYTYVPPGPDDDPAAISTTPAKAAPKTDQIPADIRAMSGKRYVIEGYVVPLDYEKGLVTKLILLPAPLACCFAEAPPMNRWIMVENGAKTEFDYSKYGLVRASGVFDVGEETREGYVVGIYRMKAEKIENVSQ